jgi:exonuclease III
MDSSNILMWNVRIVNGCTHRDALRALVMAECPSVVCVQETKLHVISD